MYLAVSDHALSVVLLAERDGCQLPVYFISHVLKKVELRYPLVEKFGLALYMAVKKLKPYFLAHPVVIYTDQPIKRPLTTLESSGRMIKWAIEIQSLEVTFEPRKAVKGQAFADFIVEMTRSPDCEEINQLWKVYVDGSSTANGCGAGIVCQSPEGDRYEYALRFKFQASNNEAEYEALLAGIRMCKAAGAKKIAVCSDSQLIVSQYNGDYEATRSAMVKYLEAVKQAANSLEDFQLTQVPRSENNQADALSKLASSASCDTPRTVFWEVLEKRSIEENNIAILDRSSTWMDVVRAYLTDDILPADHYQAVLVKKRASSFEMHKGELFKKGRLQPFLKCVTPEKGREVLEDLHSGYCASHVGGSSLAQRVRRQGYFWPTLEADAMDLVKRCDKCQGLAS
ncbi:uncharacterized protein LOC110701703 [Chenopodium quinoa]|uniref:uncharacterized protein LOC110701703 n=1 Tax=Chenopodium quinoa TaxID=63459 RepID=UPI000B77714E|nr:uncharacterized protein LOC110701703 [Chenopodium quinoa]